MATKGISIPDIAGDKCKPLDLLAWLNKCLETKFSKVDELCSGACYCQLMDCLFPGSIDLSKVKFQALEQEDFIHNLNLLQDSFKKSGVTKTVPVEALINAEFKANMSFLKWFKLFFSTNQSGQEYNALEARQGQDIPIPITASPVPCENGSPPQSPSPSDTDTDEDSLLRDKKGKTYDDQWKETYEWVEKSSLGEIHAYCRLCDFNLNIYHTGILDLKRHQQTKKHSKNALSAKAGDFMPDGEKGSGPSDSPPYSETVLRFIQKHCSSASSKGGDQAINKFTRCVLGLQYPKDIVSFCQQTPYCVYMYERIALDETDMTSVVLVGFFDVKAARHCIRLLDVLQLSNDEDDAGEKTAAALIETLKRFGLPAANLAAVYSGGNSAASEQICRQLRDLKPNVVALGGLYMMANTAYQAGVMELPNQAQELIVEMYNHYSSCSTENANLRELFANISNVNGATFLLTMSCLSFCDLVKKITKMWTDLISYFSSCEKNNKKTEVICTKLQDPKLRATFIFLDQAMGPLQTFQTLLHRHEGSERADLVHILQEASSLLRSYSSSFLRPQAVVRFLKERDAELLKNKKFHLPGAEVNMGGTAVEDFLCDSEAGEVLPILQEEAVSFYTALTSRVAEGLPLSDGVLRSMAQLLNPQSRLKVTAKAVGELGSKLGLCVSHQEVAQLTSEFLEYQLAEEENDCDESIQHGFTTFPLEQHWSTVLKASGSNTIFRKLVLTLLALPCPPLSAERVFAQAMENGDLESEAMKESEVEADVTTDSDSTTMQSPARRARKKKASSDISGGLN